MRACSWLSFEVANAQDSVMDIAPVARRIRVASQDRHARTRRPLAAGTSSPDNSVATSLLRPLRGMGDVVERVGTRLDEAEQARRWR